MASMNANHAYDEADATALIPVLVIFVCNEPVAICNDAVASPKLVTLDSNDAVASPKLLTLFSREPVADCKEAVASPKLLTLFSREPVADCSDAVASPNAVTPDSKLFIVSNDAPFVHVCWQQSPLS